MEPADPLVRPGQPRLEVADGVVEVRHGVAEALTRALHDPLVDEAGLREREIGWRAVGDHGRANLDDLGDEPDERCGGVVGHEPRPQASRIAIADLEGEDDERRAPPDPRAARRARLVAADPCLVNLDPASQLRPVEIHGRAPQLVEDHPGCLVAGDTELALEGEGREPALGGDQKEGGR